VLIEVSACIQDCNLVLDENPVPKLLLYTILVASNYILYFENKEIIFFKKNKFKIK